MRVQWSGIDLDLLNFFLIVLSFLVCFYYPYESFILAYSILGPLHYLTETNWLKKKEKEYSRWFWVAIVFSLLIVLPKWFIEFGGKNSLVFPKFLSFFDEVSNVFIFLPFFLSGFLFYGNVNFKKILLFVLLTLSGYFLFTTPFFGTIFGLLVPTLIHVYLFTIFFMASGTIRNRGRFGVLNLLLMFIAPVVIWVLPVSLGDYSVEPRLKGIFIDTHYHYTNVLFSKFLGLSDGTSFFFYEELELKMQRFISFAYLYHYLNWFSKTNVIYWHKAINKQSAILIGVSWIVMLVLFFQNYRLGFMVALLFSFIHLLMEFPLNIANFKFILRSIAGKSK